MLLLASVCFVSASPSESIPIFGRHSSLTIRLQIPRTPVWAHDIVLNASIAWNQAQLWFERAISPIGPTYMFIESNEASAIISFRMPIAYAGFAVGWTNYDYAPSSRDIISTQTFLDPHVFNSSQEGNSTARDYAFRLALHELGRILGLGSVFDGRDIMDPRNTPGRVDQAPSLSTLDLYATHILAGGNAPLFVTLPNNIQNQAIDARTLVATGVSAPIPAPEFGTSFGTIIVLTFIGGLLSHRRRAQN